MSRSRAVHVIFLLGLATVQVFLLWPSLSGLKIMLPVDLLALESYYLPRTPEYAQAEPLHPVLSDQVLIYEYQRRFAAEEIRSGRLPLWSPHQYGGAPSATFAKYSPFHLPYYLFPSPKTLVWIHLLQVLVAGLGAYVFFYRVLGISSWPAVIGAWCFPLSGFFVLWQGYPLLPALAFFPWQLVVIECVLKGPRSIYGPLLAALTGLLLISGQVDFGAQVLLASGLYALGRLFIEYRKKRQPRALLGAATALSAAWLIGILLATPYLLPILEYVGSSARMSDRQEGFEDRPPVGLQALPQTVLPQMFGTMGAGSTRIVAGNQLESSASGYAGLLATLLLAPLAWLNRRHRAQSVLWLILGSLGLVWVLNVPGIVTLLRLPGINMFSYNRFVFLSGFAVLVMATVALDSLRREAVVRRWWFAVPIVIVVALGSWCFYRAEHLPEPVATELEEMVRRGFKVWPIRGPDDAFQIRQNFRVTYLTGALWCSLTALGWSLLWSRGRKTWLAPSLAALWILELVGFASGKSIHSDPKLYYPRLQVLEKLAATTPGRVLGVRCLPPRLLESHGLRDLRGLDGIEPARAVQVLKLAQDTRFQSPDYGVTMWYVPRLRRTANGGLDLPPVLDMLNLRYLVFRGAPDPEWRPFFVAQDYWVLENEAALPRVFVPRRVETVPEGEEILRRMVAGFDPRKTAFVEVAVEVSGDLSGGTVEIVEDHPRRITVEYVLPSPGLVVLSENWDPGWRVSVDGRTIPNVRTNYSLNGAVVPAGKGRLTFEFSPVSFLPAVATMIVGLILGAAWLGSSFRTRGVRSELRAGSLPY